MAARQRTGRGAQRIGGTRDGDQRVAGLVGGCLAVGLLAAVVPGAAAAPSVATAQPAGQGGAGAVRESEPTGLGLRFHRPAAWVETRKNGHTLLLSGPPDTPQWVTTLTLTNQQNPTPSLPSQGAARLLAEYLEAVANREGGHETLREAPFHYTNPGPGVDGVQAVIRFMAATGPVRQWVVVIARMDIPAAHVVIYSAPDEAFDAGLAAARLVVDSLTLLPARR